MALKDTWVDLKDAIEGVPDSGNEVSAEPINRIAHSVISLENNGGTGKPGKSPYIGENGNWFEYNGTQYVDTGVKASGLPNVQNINSNGWEANLPAYTEVRIGQPTSYINILDFDYNTESLGNDMWAITFLADVDITVHIPSIVKWAVAEPVFTAGYTYYLSFIPFGTGSVRNILGVWVAKELSAE